jgi:DHA2 family multidrug resistance protein-like MFS transporter
MMVFTQVDPAWSSTTEIAIIMMLGFGFGLAMPTLTDTIMAAVPVEDAGVGSAVTDVSRELGSALGVAVLGSIINGIYRSNVDDALAGEVDEATVEIAQEGIGVLAGHLPTLPTDTGAVAFGAASDAFVDAMNGGFWFSAGVVGLAVVVAATMLPNRARTEQVARHAAAGDVDPVDSGDSNPDRELAPIS